jgi:hypothetical protein
LKEAVDLFVNTFERTYTKVLSEGFFPSIEEQNQYRFSNRITLINNVQSRKDASIRADILIERGEIDAYYFVADYLDQALEKTGLNYEDLGRVQHYTDCALVAVTLSKSPWLLYWDAEISLQKPVNWIDPAINLMKNEPFVFAANPNPDPNWVKDSIKNGTLEIKDDFALGYGFSDQVFLVRSKESARPIYKEKCLASLRYPMAHIGSIFEKRVDAYMRTHRRLRAIHIPAKYIHQPDTCGLSYPPELSLKERIRKIRNEYLHRKLRNKYVHKILKCIGIDSPCLKI